MRAVLICAMLLTACGARWTPEDRAAELAVESMCSRIYSLPDIGPAAPTYARACVCAIQASLAAHDAGRLIGDVECVAKRAP